MDHFELVSEYKPTGDQPQEIEELVKGFKEGNQFQTLLGVTGSGKTFTMANVIQQLNKPTLIIAHNKTLAAQLYSEFKEFFPNNAVEYFVFQFWENENVPTCIEVLKSIRNTGLLKLGNRIDDILSESIEDEDIRITALRNALSFPFDELERYYSYVTDNTRFATHQGVKGLEFPRVMVIMDDTQARGFLFSYEKLFGSKSKTDMDLKNEREGKATSLTRTARLFYVACTRAQESLAVVAYSENIYSVKNTALSNGWFHEEEIYLFNEKTIKFEKTK